MSDGRYEYYYEYDIIVFSENGRSLVARSYSESPEEAHFLRVESNSDCLKLSEEDLKDGLASKAIAYLRSQGRSEINWLSGRGNGYEPVPKQ